MNHTGDITVEKILVMEMGLSFSGVIKEFLWVGIAIFIIIKNTTNKKEWSLY